jgi:arylsulfatase A-like enzyme
MLREKAYSTAMFDKWHVGRTFLDPKENPILSAPLR